MVIKIKRKNIVTISIAVAFLFFSSATLIPQAYSKPVMETINLIEQKQENMEETKSIFSSESLQIDGFLEWLIQLIRTLIQLVFRIIEIVQGIISIISLIQSLINALQTLIQLLQELISLIQDLFNPQFASY